MTAKELLDNILTREGMYSNISNYFNSTELHVQENIKILNSLLDELVDTVNFHEMLEEFTFTTYSEWAEGTQYYQNGLPVYVLSNAMDGYRYQPESSGISTVSPASLNLKPGQEGQTSDGITWRCLGSWCEYPIDEMIPDYKSISVNTLVDFSRRLPLIAIDDEEWQKRRMYQVKSYNGYFQLRGKRLFLFPGFADATQISFFYYSNLPVKDSDGVRKQHVTNNEDMVILPDLLLTLGTAYKWQKDKGLSTYQELETGYKNLLGTYQALAKSGKRIKIGKGSKTHTKPVPDGFSNSDIVIGL